MKWWNDETIRCYPDKKVKLCNSTEDRGFFNFFLKVVELGPNGTSDETHSQNKFRNLGFNDTMQNVIALIALIIWNRFLKLKAFNLCFSSNLDKIWYGYSYFFDQPYWQTNTDQ